MAAQNSVPMLGIWRYMLPSLIKAANDNESPDRQAAYDALYQMASFVDTHNRLNPKTPELPSVTLRRKFNIRENRKTITIERGGLMTVRKAGEG